MYYSTRKRKEESLLKYYKEIKTKEGFTLSIDMVTIDYSISSSAARDELAKILDNLPLLYAVEVRHWSSLRIGTFRENFVLKFQDQTSFWLGVGLNAHKPLWGRSRIEFNPNKVANHKVFLELLGWFNIHSLRMNSIIKRFDLAIDIPFGRQSVRLLKDRRVYTERRHGQEWTEYLGKSSTVGRVKLYNKTVEAGLNYPLTRLELTLDPAIPFQEIPWPSVYYIVSRQIGMGELRVTDTERFVLGALLEGYGSVVDLGHKTRTKMEVLMNGYVKWVSISLQDYALILSCLQSFLNYPALVDLSGANVIADAPPPSPVPEWVQEAEQGIEEAVRQGE